MTPPADPDGDSPDFEKAAPGCLAAMCSAGLLTAVPLFLSGEFALAFIFFVAALSVAGLHALFFGLPLYHLLSLRGRPGLAAALTGGLAVGALPSLVIIVLTDGSSGGLPGPGGWFEPERWVALLGVPLWFGGSGLVGGLAFWAVALREKKD